MAQLHGPWAYTAKDFISSCGDTLCLSTENIHVHCCSACKSQEMHCQPTCPSIDAMWWAVEMWYISTIKLSLSVTAIRSPPFSSVVFVVSSLRIVYLILDPKCFPLFVLTMMAQSVKMLPCDPNYLCMVSRTHDGRSKPAPASCLCCLKS